MKIISQYKLEILAFFLLIVLYFLLRVPNLTLQPIFADEAIYIRWAQVMRAESTLRFLPLFDGKTPLFMWSMMPVLKFIEDPLFAGRFLSVVSGFMSLVGVIVLGWKVFGKKVALWAGFLYVITPYIVFFDRMALVDSMLAAFTVWAIYFAIWLSQTVRLDLSMILGFILGGGILTKTPGMINLLLVPVSFLAFRDGGARFAKRENRGHKLVKLMIFWAVAIGIALVAYNLLRLGPNFHQLSARNADYVFSPLELIGRPLDPFIPHLRDISDWFPKLLSWPVLLIGGIGVIRVIGERNRLGLVVLLWGLIPLLLEMAFLRPFTARYLLASIPPFLVIAGYGIEKISSIKYQVSSKIVKMVVLVILLIPALNFNYLLLTDPQKAPLPRAERIGYFEEWTAGYGFKEIAEYLVERKKQTNVVVGTEGYFGTLPDGLQIYLDKAGIPIIGSHATISAQLREALKDNEVYFVANRSRLMEHQSGLELIMEFPKVKSLDGQQDAIQLFRIISQK
ncbi:hypothetical protein A3B45_03330 [Candidatus Daviesbacteria bacterium RIFCSPLOWO2_01_FULL_39_12]|uniref:Glycosyltransferase RgtA/B/C/D-like domain-containing protein n=1 Tax=Candidatus Daviesbacteria bacterium RIFCSPLOWO2_01_FULL_39_12 TaxID=1797785 RepID=A0A1F5KS86_9BACT|nr:MAG: hypothetical protein A3B45_03330 [Candidatus Daviesbacteria bacterium RIFCSPLOWO2_01_FULL_39_12]